MGEGAGDRAKGEGAEEELEAHNEAVQKMKKDYIRDYATKMFREYAAAGEPTYEREKRRLYESELKRHARMDPAKAQAIAQKAVDLSAPYHLDSRVVE